MKLKIELSKKEREQSISEIQRYFLQERNEEIGNLASDILLDFITNNIGPAFYNKGIKDAISVMNEKVDDLYGLEIN